MLWFIPDIHGRFHLLLSLWNTLLDNGFDISKDKLVFGGDMIDRGWQSRDVVHFIMKKAAASPNIIVLRGNHEDFAIQAHTTRGMEQVDVRSCWTLPNNGGTATLASFGGQIPDEIIGWFQSLPISHEEPGFFFSHAPAPRENRRNPALHGKPFTEHELLWTYSADEFGVARDFKDKIGFCWHIHKLHDGIMEPRFYPHYIFADAGCGCHPKAPLVAIEVKTRKVLYAHPDMTRPLNLC
jgi:hypothetical protein